MTAKEMFEKLGYVKKPITGMLIYENKGLTLVKEIMFRTEDKTYITCLIDSVCVPYRQPVVVNANEHNAITQQMKELGWL